MPGYRVCFFNEIRRNERLFRCCQRWIVIRAARTPEPAIEAAKKRFARLEGIRDWKTHAKLIDIEPIALEPTPPSPPSHAARIHGHEKDVRHPARSGPGLAAQRGSEGGLPSDAPPVRRQRVTR
jgi:hypothetical protein